MYLTNKQIRERMYINPKRVALNYKNLRERWTREQVEITFDRWAAMPTSNNYMEALIAARAYRNQLLLKKNNPDYAIKKVLRYTK